MVTIEELMDTIEMQEREIERLSRKLDKLQAWSDYNDLTLQELIDNLTDTVDKLIAYHRNDPGFRECNKEDSVNGIAAPVVSNP